MAKVAVVNAVAEHVSDGRSLGSREENRTCVGEDVRIPRHGKSHPSIANASPMRSDRHEEKPQCQAPKPESHPRGPDFTDLAG